MPRNRRKNSLPKKIRKETISPLSSPLLIFQNLSLKKLKNKKRSISMQERLISLNRLKRQRRSNPSHCLSMKSWSSRHKRRRKMLLRNFERKGKQEQRILWIWHILGHQLRIFSRIPRRQQMSNRNQLHLSIKIWKRSWRCKERKSDNISNSNSN